MSDQVGRTLDVFARNELKLSWVPRQPPCITWGCLQTVSSIGSPRTSKRASLGQGVRAGVGLCPTPYSRPETLRCRSREWGSRGPRWCCGRVAPLPSTDRLLGTSTSGRRAGSRVWVTLLVCPSPLPGAGWGSCCGFVFTVGAWEPWNSELFDLLLPCGGYCPGRSRRELAERLSFSLHVSPK